MNPFDAGNIVREGHFVSVSAGATDEHKVVKLGSDGQFDRSVLKKHLFFGGDGSDGDLSISSGTTSISADSNRFVVKNYNDLSITGTGKLAFTTPHADGTVVWLRVAGDLTITSSTAPCIDASSMGASGASSRSIGGSNGSTTTSGNADSGSGGQVSTLKTNAGGGGQGYEGNVGVGGAVITAFTFWQQLLDTEIRNKYPYIFGGSGGGAGGATWSVATNGAFITTGAGGRGGGALIIEVAGKINFTTANGISVSGGNGGNATSSIGGAGTTYATGGGGGGGAGGFCGLYYNDSIDVSGTINVAGGVGGNCHITGSATSYGGGGGGSRVTVGSNGSTTTTSGNKNGGNGAIGEFVFVKNIIYT